MLKRKSKRNDELPRTKVVDWGFNNVLKKIDEAIKIINNKK